MAELLFLTGKEIFKMKISGLWVEDELSSSQMWS